MGAKWPHTFQQVETPHFILTCGNTYTHHYDQASPQIYSFPPNMPLYFAQTNPGGPCPQTPLEQGYKLLLGFGCFPCKICQWPSISQSGWPSGPNNAHELYYVSRLQSMTQIIFEPEFLDLLSSSESRLSYQPDKSTIHFDVDQIITHYL